MANDMIEQMKSYGIAEEIAYRAIEAIHEPTDEVLDAMAHAAHADAGTAERRRAFFLEIYQAAIDEILRKPKHIVFDTRNAKVPDAHDC